MLNLLWGESSETGMIMLRDKGLHACQNIPQFFNPFADNQAL